MKIKTATITRIFTIISMIFGVLMGGGRAETIIEDFFSRTGSIDGSSPDTGPAWSGSGWTTNGTELSTSGSNASVISGLTFAPDTIYTLTMDVSVTSGGSDWIGFGFTTAGGNPASNSRGFMLHRQNPQIQFFSTGTSGAQAVPSTSAFPNTLEIELTTGATLATSTLTYRLNGAVVGNSVATDASTIDAVFVQNIGGATGTVDNFVLRKNSVFHTDTFLEGTPNEFHIDFVQIGDAGNPDDSTGFGSVNYDYSIGKYEIEERLIHAYNAGNLGNTLDITMDSRGLNQPATNVSWNEAARFVNWLNLISGFPDAYKFTTSGANDNISVWEVGDAGYNPDNIFRNSNAFYFLPSGDEWYKAAFYDEGMSIYYDYATGSDTAPVATDGGTNIGTAVYRDGVNPNPPGPADVSNAGGLSPYGTMAQNGNVWEWSESGWSNRRLIFSGDWNDAFSSLRSSRILDTYTTFQGYSHGFRVASKPLGPEISVEQSVGDDLVSGVSVTDFGSVWAGSEPASQIFTICNEGNLPLEDLTVTITGLHADEFEVVANNLGTSLDPGECATITVEFTTLDKGPREAVLEIGSNDSDEPVFTIDLTGEKVTPPPTDIVLDPDSVEENQPAGTLVGTLTATDLDQADGFVFTLVSGTGDDDNDCFSIGGPNGDQLFTTKPFDEEEQGTYSILVEVTDNDGQTYEEVIIITVSGDCLEWWVEVEKALALGRIDKHNYFGISVSVSGDTAIVGAPNANPLDDVPGYPGGAYVYQKVNGVWGRTQILYASDRESLDDFGGAVCVEGNYAIVGAKANEDRGAESGTAYIFERPDSSSPFVEVQKLDDNNGQVGDFFGSAVGVLGDTAVVGAPGDNFGRGAVHVFRRSVTGNWQRPQGQMVASDGAGGDQFGASLSLSGNVVLIGAPGDDTAGGVDAGSAYLYTRSSATSAFLQENILRAGDGEGGDAFGTAVSVSGDMAMVGAPFDDHPLHGVNAGSVSVFSAGNGWSEVQTIVTDDAVAEGRFGFSVSVSGDNAVAGAPFYNDGVTISPGRGYAFRRESGGGGFVQYQVALEPSDGGSADYFGGAVSLSAGNLLFGAPLDDDVMGVSLQQPDRGSAYFFAFEASTPLAPTGLTLTPVNPHAPFWGPFSSHFGHAEVEENEPVGIVVGTFSTNHPYQVDGFTYELVPGPGDADNGSFSIGGPEVDQLLTAEVFNYEVKGLYRVRVRVTECTGLSYERTMDVHIGNVWIEFEIETYWDTINGVGFVDASRLPGADPYKRGIQNGLAYALAIPMSGSLTDLQRARLPTAKAVAGSGVTMEFVRPEIVPDGVTYEIQIWNAAADDGGEDVFREFIVRTANGGWTGEGAGNIIEMPAVDGFVRVCVEFPETESNRGLMRLSVEIAE